MTRFIFSIGGSHQGQKKMGVEAGYTAALSSIPDDVIMNDKRKSDIFDKPIYGSYLLGKSMLQTHKQENPTGNSIFFTMGGCHIVTFGTYWAASNLSSDIHLIWIDAHPDINTPATSYTGNCHGMPMAYIFGLAATKKVKDLKTLDPSRMAYLGLRCIDDEEELFLQDLEKKGMQRFSTKDIKKLGILTVLEKIQTQWLSRHPEPLQIHVSLDVDSMDPEFTPATGTPVADGMHPDEIISTIKWANRLSKFGKCHLDIVEINPSLSNLHGVITTYKTTQKIVDAYFGGT